MKICFVLFLFLSGCAASDAKRTAWHAERYTFQYDRAQNTITAMLGERKVSFTTQAFSRVLDWSDDYSRKNAGTVWMANNNLLIFSGYVNHSQSLLFFHNLLNDRTCYLPYIERYGVDTSHGWYAVQGSPIYGEFTLNHTLLANGHNICNLTNEVDAVRMVFSNGDLLVKHREQALHVEKTCAYKICPPVTDLSFAKDVSFQEEAR